MHQRRDGARLALELHEAVARPAALKEELVHQEARGNVAAVAAEVLTERLLGSLVGVNEVGRGEVVVEAVLRGHVEVNAHFGVDAAAIAHPRLVVAEEHEHDGLIARFQLAREAAHLLDRAADAGQVVVDDAAAFHRPAGLGGRDVLLPVGLGAVRPVVLVRDGEEEERVIVLRARVDVV